MLRAQVRPSVQAILFRAALEHLSGRADFIDRVLEVDVDPDTRARLKPNVALEPEEWRAIEASVRPSCRERGLR